MTSPPHQSGGRGTYICDPGVCFFNPDSRPVGHRYEVCWHEDTQRRLEWLYGARRANLIALGKDYATEEDLRAWRELGA